MFNEVALLESRTLRESVAERTEVLNRVKALSLLPDGMHVTTAMVAVYFEVAETVINNLLSRHREELESNGLKVLRGADLQDFKELTLRFYPQSYPQPRAGLAVWPRRAVLNVAMLLRDSEVARQVRTYLLDVEQASRTHQIIVDAPDAAEHVQSLDDHIDRRITHVLGKTVVPMLNALIEASGEQRRHLLSAQEDIERAQRKLAQHEQRTHRLELAQEKQPISGVMASLDAMNWREFEHHVAGLLRRDGCTDVVVHKKHGDRGADITGLTTDGRTVVVQCKNWQPFRQVLSGEMQKFLGTAKVLHKEDVALYVATCQFTREAKDIAVQGGITAVHRTLLEAWSAGAKLQVLR
jgi:restriction system protein